MLMVIGMTILKQFTLIKRIDNIKLAGYDVIYIWENEFNEMGT
jgi:hypothetical protein